MKHKTVHTSFLKRHWTSLVSILSALLGWELLSRFAGLPAFILPSPPPPPARAG